MTCLKQVLLGLMVMTLNSVCAQSWTWTELNSMPEPVSNNSVVSAFSNDTLCVYSFTGIDSSKTSEGIHLKSWKYNTISELWTQLDDVPDFRGKIAASASEVNGKIYLIGGYYVYENDSEESSDDVHIFDPNTDSWLENGSTIPTPIDDHVYDVWRDSLICIVTGWFNTGNVRDVQWYNPELDEWTQANDLPITQSYPVFGGSGEIINDTIFYAGGVNNGFNTMSRLRRGIINAEDPTEIEWSVVEESPYGNLYRSGAASYNGRLFYIGGSADGYNYDGISYDTNEGVNTENRIITYYSQWGIWEEEASPYGIMDIRGLAQLTESSWILCGGMMDDQNVSNRVFLLELDPTTEINEEKHRVQSFYNSNEQIYKARNIEANSTIKICTSEGKILIEKAIVSENSEIKCQNLPTGLYIVSCVKPNGTLLFVDRFIKL